VGEVAFRILAEWWIVSMLCGYVMGLSGMMLCARGGERKESGGGGGSGGSSGGKGGETGEGEEEEEEEEEDDDDDDEASHAWRGLKFMLLVPFYALHCFVLGIRNYPFAYFANLVMVPVVCGAFPYVSNRESGSQARRGGGRSCCNVLARGAHAMLLVASSPPAIVFFWVPVAASVADPELMFDGGRVGGGSGISGVVGAGISAEVSDVWARVFRNWSEMGTFHAPYFAAFYVPMHMVATHITMMAGETDYSSD
jgi:hypothetical protein